MPDARQLPRTLSVKLLPDGKVIMTKGILMNFISLTKSYPDPVKYSNRI